MSTLALRNNVWYVDNCMISWKWMSVKVFVLGLAAPKQQRRCLQLRHRRLAMKTFLKGTLPTFSGHFLKLGVAEGALPSKGKEDWKPGPIFVLDYERLT